VPQLEKFAEILSQHKQQLQAQMADLQANLDEVKAQEKEVLALLNKHLKTAKRRPS